MSSSNLGVPPRNDSASDDYPVLYNEGSEELKYVKTGVKNTINTGGASYLVYTALLTQSGTDAPTVISNGNNTPWQNTIGSIVWTRTGVGAYAGTLNGAFPEGKTVAPPWGGASALIPVYGASIAQAYYEIQRTNDNAIGISFYDSDFNAVEWSSINTFIFVEIRVYP